MSKSNLLMRVAGNILSSDKYPLDSLGNINIQLGLIAYKSENPCPKKEEWASYKMFSRIVEISKGNNEKLRQLDSQTRYILNGKILSAKTKGKLLEKIGYEVI